MEPLASFNTSLLFHADCVLNVWVSVKIDFTEILQLKANEVQITSFTLSIALLSNFNQPYPQPYPIWLHFLNVTLLWIGASDLTFVYFIFILVQSLVEIDKTFFTYTCKIISKLHAKFFTHNVVLFVAAYWHTGWCHICTSDFLVIARNQRNFEESGRVSRISCFDGRPVF